jgi:hypothetical protein
MSADYNSLGDRALRLYIKTQDPLTYSAAKILLAADPNKEATVVVKRAVALVRRQLKAYETLYTEPL